MTNSEIFEQVAAGSVSVDDAANVLLKSDEERRRRTVADARPQWIPVLAWALVATVILAGANWFRRYAS